MTVLGHSRLFKPSRCLVLLFSLFVSPTLYADKFILEAGSGFMYPTNDNFDEVSTHYINLGMSLGPLAATVGRIDNGELHLSGVRASHIRLNGNTALLSWAPGYETGGISIGVGLFDWDAKFKYRDRTIGKDSDVSPMLELRAVRKFNSAVQLYLSGRHFDDVSGTDLNSISFGIRLSF